MPRFTPKAGFGGAAGPFDSMVHPFTGTFEAGEKIIVSSGFSVVQVNDVLTQHETALGRRRKSSADLALVSSRLKASTTERSVDGWPNAAVALVSP